MYALHSWVNATELITHSLQFVPGLFPQKSNQSLCQLAPDTHHLFLGIQMPNKIGSHTNQNIKKSRNILNNRICRNKQTTERATTTSDNRRFQPVPPSREVQIVLILVVIFGAVQRGNESFLESVGDSPVLVLLPIRLSKVTAQREDHRLYGTRIPFVRTLMIRMEHRIRFVLHQQKDIGS